MKSRLNPVTLSNMTLHGFGYMLGYVLLNSWITLEDEFFNVLIITARYLIEVKRRHFDGFEPTHRGVDTNPLDETRFILNDIATWMMLSYRLNIWNYQLHMHHIPRF